MLGKHPTVTDPGTATCTYLNIPVTHDTQWDVRIHGRLTSRPISAIINNAIADIHIGSMVRDA